MIYVSLYKTMVYLLRTKDRLKFWQSVTSHSVNFLEEYANKKTLLGQGQKINWTRILRINIFKFIQKTSASNSNIFLDTDSRQIYIQTQI